MGQVKSVYYYQYHYYAIITMDKTGRKRFIFATQKILRCEFSAKRDFASVDAKLRLTQRAP